jgi:hypothetical protein
MAAQKLRKMITDWRTVQRTKKNRYLTADVGSQAKILQEEVKTRHKSQTKETSSTRNLQEIQQEHLRSRSNTSQAQNKLQIRFFFIEIEQDLHTSTEDTVIPPSFD